MINQYLNYIARFGLLVFLQVFVFNHVQLAGYINPYPYVLAVLWLPVEWSKTTVLLLGFSCGLVIDALSGSWGMHAAATTGIAYVRPFLLRLTAPREGYETGSLPTVSSQGITWFITYSIIMILIHHLLLFSVEYFKFSSISVNLKRAFYSAIFTETLVLLSSYFNVRSPRNE